MESRKIIWFLILSTLSISLYRCKPEEIILPGEIGGIVTDAETGQPLTAATVILNPSNDTTNTGSGGKYLFKSLTPGDYEIQASKQNYAERTKPVNVTSAYTSEINLALEQIPIIHYSDSILDFGFYLTSLSFTISKTGHGKVTYIISPSKDWITVNHSFGDVDNETDSIIVAINRTGLTQNIINEWIKIRSTYLQYDFLDTVNVNLKVHSPIIFNPDLSYGTITDIEGNLYKTIKIGNDVWMAENLKTTKYNDNTPIPLVEDNVAWKNLKTPAYCWYNNDKETYKDIYGALYTWYTVNIGKLCPKDWHVSTDAEWTVLIDNLGGINAAVNKMRETGINHWKYEKGATNSSGFTALPGNFRNAEYGNFFTFFANGEIGVWWTATNSDFSEPYDWYLIDNLENQSIERAIDVKGNGISVRCIKDQ
jgi:uncharacterized protein (TIGR02145 family)